MERAEKGELRVTWLGYSSSLVQLGEHNVLIDPVMGGRSSPVSFADPRRFSEVALSLDNIPEIDVLFISHDHYAGSALIASKRSIQSSRPIRVCKYRKGSYRSGGVILSSLVHPITSSRAGLFSFIS